MCLKPTQACWAQANVTNMLTMQPIQAKYELHSDKYHLFQTEIYLDFVPRYFDF